MANMVFAYNKENAKFDRSFDGYLEWYWDDGYSSDCTGSPVPQSRRCQEQAVDLKFDEYSITGRDPFQNVKVTWPTAVEPGGGDYEDALGGHGTVNETFKSGRGVGQRGVLWLLDQARGSVSYPGFEPDAQVTVSYDLTVREVRHDRGSAEQVYGEFNGNYEHG